MTTAAALFQAVTDRGHLLVRFGDSLGVVPGIADAELVAALSERTDELADLLDRSTRHLAQQVLLGEFDECDSATTARLLFTLRSATQHLCCRAACFYLEPPATWGTE